MKIPIYIILIFTFTFTSNLQAQDGFTQTDRERMIRTEITLQEFMKSTDKRFEMIDKRFEMIDKRFELIDKRFEETNLNFNNRLQEMNNYLLLVITIFATLSGGIFVYIIWDRKSFMNAALQNAKSLVDNEINALQKEGKLNDLINAMRELAQDDAKVKTILTRFHLL